MECWFCKGVRLVIILVLKSYKYDFNNYAVGSTGTKEIQDFYRRNNYELVSNKSDIDKSINAYDNQLKLILKIFTQCILTKNMRDIKCLYSKSERHVVA